MTQSIRLDLPLLLPEVQDVQDACVVRLTRLLERQAGVTRVHVLRSRDVGAHSERMDAADQSAVPGTSEGRDSAQLCLHYDPEQLTLEDVEHLARTAGAEVSERFAHVVMPVRAIATEGDGPRIEADMKRVPGVTACTVSLAGQVVRVEYDRRRTTLDQLVAALTSLDVQPAIEAIPDSERPAEPKHDGPPPSWYGRNRELVWSLTAGVFMGAGWIAERQSDSGAAVPIALFVISYLFGGRDNVGHFLKPAAWPVPFQYRPADGGGSHRRCATG